MIQINLLKQKMRAIRDEAVFLLGRKNVPEEQTIPVSYKMMSTDIKICSEQITPQNYVRRHLSF